MPVVGGRLDQHLALAVHDGQDVAPVERDEQLDDGRVSARSRSPIVRSRSSTPSPVRAEMATEPGWSTSTRLRPLGVEVEPC